MFQQIYYYTGFTPIKGGDVKLLSFNSTNPIKVSIPRLIYDEVVRFEENLSVRNKRLLNLYTPNNMKESSGFSILRLMNLSYS